MRETKFPLSDRIFPLNRKSWKYPPFDLSVKDRLFVVKSLPVIPFLLPVPERPEYGYDHRQHNEEPNAEKPPEQDIHHGSPPFPSWDHEGSSAGFLPVISFISLYTMFHWINRKHRHMRTFTDREDAARYGHPPCVFHERGNSCPWEPGSLIMLYFFESIPVF